MKKTAIVYGARETELQKRAIEELTEILLDCTLEYPACVKYEEGIDTDDFRCIYIGTKQNNSYIKSRSVSGLTVAESYAISVKDGTVIIEGFDDAGTLYGVLDFYNKYVAKFNHPHNDRYWVNFWVEEEIPDFEHISAPSVAERGLWTWGHVIYDYRGYIRHMMKLKMNSVIIWNDFVPANAAEIVEYAHSCNIKVYWGFAWLWDTNCRLFFLDKLDGEPEKILQKYEKEYANSGGDGIYFQTFTELREDNVNGILVAEAAAKFVNKTAALLYEKYPGIELQFGLHATSVKNRLEFIREVDKRIRIVWEDCGSFPFSYVPFDVEGFDETLDFTKNIAVLRGDDDRFGAVTKGLVKLDWSTFEHSEGSQCIGVCSEHMRRNRVERKARIWRCIQAGWLANADKAHEAVRDMCRTKKGALSLFALVEDGMFEENIMYPVALYSEMLWDCETDIKTLETEVALREYVSFA